MRAKIRSKGFSLIELMISVTIALIVTGSAVALMVSVMQANGQNVASTRLTQELRAVADVVARDVKRARYMEDAISFVGEMNDDDNGDGVVNASDYMPTNPYEAITVTADAAANDGDAATDRDGTCVEYSYESDDLLGRHFRAVHRRLDAADRGAVFIARGTTAPGCIAQTRLSSPEVNITQLAFNYNTTDDWMRITIAGSLVNDPAIVRQISTSVRFRSQAVPGP